MFLRLLKKKVTKKKKKKKNNIISATFVSDQKKQNKTKQNKTKQTKKKNKKKTLFLKGFSPTHEEEIGKIINVSPDSDPTTSKTKVSACLLYLLHVLLIFHWKLQFSHHLSSLC